RLAPVHEAVPVLEVRAVLGEEVGPGVPVLADGAGAPVDAERVLQLRAAERTHGSSPWPAWSAVVKSHSRRATARQPGAFFSAWSGGSPCHDIQRGRWDAVAPSCMRS